MSHWTSGVTLVCPSLSGQCLLLEAGGEHGTSLSWALPPAQPSLSWQGSMVASARKGSFPVASLSCYLCLFFFFVVYLTQMTLFFLSWVKGHDPIFLVYLGHGHTNPGIYTRQGVLSKSEYGSLESITLLAAELHWDWNQCVIIPWCNGRNTELWSFLRLVFPLGSLRYSVQS